MTDPERRRRVEEVCDAALDRDVRERAAFVAAACGDDDALRREVEALLAHAPEAEELPRGADGRAWPRRSWPTSRRVARRAGRSVRTRSSRSWARAGWARCIAPGTRSWAATSPIKVVASAFLSEPEHLARFEREARVLATLNHPHIGAIYGLQESDGVRGLVLELVEGADAGRAPGVGARCRCRRRSRSRARSRTRSKRRTTRASSTAT